MATTERDKGICDLFLALAEEELANHATLRACDKAWDAVAHCVKSIARERGWPNRSHNDVRNNVRRLLNHSNNPAFDKLTFRAVQFLHTNFYEELMDAEDVQDGITDAKRLVEVLNSVDSRMPR